MATSILEHNEYVSIGNCEFYPSLFFPQQNFYNNFDIGHCVRPVVGKCSNPNPALRRSQSSLVTLLFVCACVCKFINSYWRCLNHGLNQAVMSVVTRGTILLPATPAPRPLKHSHSSCLQYIHVKTFIHF